MLKKEIFSSKKIIPGFFYNLLGLQIFRICLSYLIIKISKTLLNPKKNNFLNEKLYSEGYFIKDFLKRDKLKKLKEICDEEMHFANLINKGEMKESIVSKEVLIKRNSKLFDFVKDIKIKEIFDDLEAHKIDFSKLNISIEKTSFGKTYS